VLLVPGVLHGYRLWRLRPDNYASHPTAQPTPNTGGILVGNFGQPWAGPTLEAACLRRATHMWIVPTKTWQDMPRCEQSPGKTCRCGIYGLHTGVGSVDLQSQSDYDFIGVVEASGRTFLGDKGFRTRNARILALSAEPQRRAFIIPHPPAYHDGPAATSPSLAEQIQYRRRLLDASTRYAGVPVFNRTVDMLAEFPPPDVTHIYNAPR
jgi:hypothetical protein